MPETEKTFVPGDFSVPIFANHDRVTPERMGELVEALRSGEVPAPARGEAPKDFRDASRILAGAEDA